MASWLDTPVAGPYSMREMARGLREAIYDPVQQDVAHGNRAIKQVREQYPTADTLVGIHPAVAAAQVANDMMAGQVGGDTAVNVAQAVPLVKKANMLHKGLRVAGYGYDPRATMLKNSLLSQAQVFGQSGNAE